MCDWDWVDEIINKPIENKPELPEDLYFYFTRKSPKVQEIIDRLDLDMEM